MNFNLNKVAVIGSGVMGAGIASHIVGAGIPVCLFDIVPRELSEDDIKKGLTQESKAFRNKFAQAGKDGVTNKKTGLIYDADMANMIEVCNLSDDLEKLGECDWIIEVIVERLDIKKNLMKQLAEYAKDSAIITTNTSGISVNKIVEDMPLEFRERFLGTHFFNPPRYMRLFEVIPCDDTSEEVFEFMKYVGSHLLGKGVVVAKDTPNFIGNRIGVYSSVLTFKIMEKYNFNFEQVDQITGPLMGRPKTASFKTADLVGLDILDHTSQTLYNNVGDGEDKSIFILPDYVKEMIENKQLGNKTRQGFYKKVKTEKGKAVLVWDKDVKEYVPTTRELLPEVVESSQQKTLKDKLNTLVYGEGKANKFAWDIIKSVLLYSANRVPEIADDYKEIDKAMNRGYNWEVGPFEIWDMIGVEKSISKMREEGEVIPEWVLVRLSKGKTSFYDEKHLVKTLDKMYPVVREEKNCAVLDMGDGVLCLEFRSRGNSINPDILDVISETVKEIEENPNYKGLVIGNNSNNFSAGADLFSICKMVEANDEEGLKSMLAKFQKASMDIKYANKPVVVAPRGMTLGGGLEITMHSHCAVAHAETYMGLVEAGVGIVPAGGGVKELLVRCMEDVDVYNLSDLGPVIRKVWENIAMAKVSKNAFDAIKLGYLRKTDRIVMNIDEQLEEAKKQVLRMVEDGFRPNIKKAIKVTGTTGKAFLDYMAYNMKEGNMISAYDYEIAQKIADTVTGGDVPKNTVVTEEQILALEAKSTLSLLKNEKTQQRMMNMSKTGKPLRN